MPTIRLSALDTGIEAQANTPSIAVNSGPFTNSTGSSLPKFAAVAMAADGTIKLASAADATALTFSGFTLAIVPNATEGSIRTAGASSYIMESGEVLSDYGSAYLSTEGGKVTATAPTASGTRVLKVGVFTPQGILVQPKSSIGMA